MQQKVTSESLYCSNFHRSPSYTIKGSPGCTSFLWSTSVSSTSFVVCPLLELLQVALSVFGVFLVRIFQHSDTPYLSVFSTNAGKYGPEKFRIRKLFTQCSVAVLVAKQVFEGVFHISVAITSCNKSNKLTSRIFLKVWLSAETCLSRNIKIKSKSYTKKINCTFEKHV